MAEFAISSSDFVTRDLSLAAYLSEHGLPLRFAGRDAKTHDFQFVLEDPRGQAEGMKVDWHNSCCRRQIAAEKSVKTIMRSGAQSGSGGR